MVKISKWRSFVIYLFVTLLTLPALSCSSIAQVFKKPPNAPTNLSGQADSYTQVTIRWTDNSDNEDGFKIYRNGVSIGSIGANSQVFQDSGLQYSTNYGYSVSAFNDKGETKSASAVNIKTLNPPIVMTLDRIGVLKDHDPLSLLQGAGDIYLYLAITDGKGQPQVIRIPETEEIKLNDNESKNVGQLVFSTNSIGDELKIVAVAFDSDPAISGVIRKLLTGALVAYLGGGVVVSGAASMITTLVHSQPTADEGAPVDLAESPEDDFVGAIERNWTASENWGIGSYSDVRSGDLRLWFTISLPGGTVTSPQQPSAPNYPTVTVVAPPPTFVPPPTIIAQPPVVSAPPTTTIVQPVKKPLSVSFNGWFMDGIQVTTATKGKTVISRFTIAGGSSAQYKIRVRRDIRWADDQTVAELTFNHDGNTVTKEVAFTATYATDESSTDGYHADLLMGTSTIWTMTNAYPPRLRVKK